MTLKLPKRKSIWSCLIFRWVKTNLWWTCKRIWSTKSLLCRTPTNRFGKPSTKASKWAKEWRKWTLLWLFVTCKAWLRRPQMNKILSLLRIKWLNWLERSTCELSPRTSTIEAVSSLLERSRGTWACHSSKMSKETGSPLKSTNTKWNSSTTSPTNGQMEATTPLSLSKMIANWPIIGTLVKLECLEEVLSCLCMGMDHTLASMLTWLSNLRKEDLSSLVLIREGLGRVKASAAGSTVSSQCLTT